MNAKGLVMAVGMLMVQLLLMAIYYGSTPPVAAFIALFAVAQLVGIFLTSFGAYRAGGVVQIVASALFIPIGVLGIVGGMRSWRYLEEARLRALTNAGQPAHPYGPASAAPYAAGQPAYPSYAPAPPSQPYAPPQNGGPADPQRARPWPGQPSYPAPPQGGHDPD